MPPKMPIAALKKSGRHKRSKKQIEQREKSEIKIGSEELILPANVKCNPIALKKWKELSKLYEDIEYVSSADSDIVAQYCCCYAEYIQLEESSREILDELSKNKKLSALGKIELYNKSNVDHMINKKCEMLNKLRGKLYLDPTSRVKGIPIKEPEKPKSPLNQFGIS